MIFNFKSLTRYTLVLIMSLVLAACATAPKETTSTKSTTSSSSSSSEVSKPQVVDGVYVGSDTVEMLAVNVPDRIFFAYDSYSLTSGAQDTLAKQAKWLKANGSVTISIEGHADERGTREYNLALGERRANAAKDYLMTYGISGNRISVISYGKERPVDSGSNPLAWSKNRRSVSVKAN